MTLIINGNDPVEASHINTNRHVELAKHNISQFYNHRNIVPDTLPMSINGDKFIQYYHQLAERVRELEDKISPDFHSYPIYSPYSAVTPCSNIGTNVISNYSRSQNFPMNLVSSNSFIPTQPFGLSQKVLERAHDIPERFWIDWQQKQMQRRVEEFDAIKSTPFNLNENVLTPTNCRKNLLLLDQPSRHINRPQSITLNKTIPMNLDNETSLLPTNDHSVFNFTHQSIYDTDITNENDSNQKSKPTLDRSRLTIYLPFSHTNDLPQQKIPNPNESQSFDTQLTERANGTSDTSTQIISSSNSLEDVAEIDTELNLTILSRNNSDQTNPLLYSKAILNRTIEFRSLLLRKDSLSQQNQILSNKEMVN